MCREGAPPHSRRHPTQLWELSPLVPFPMATKTAVPFQPQRTKPRVFYGACCLEGAWRLSPCWGIQRMCGWVGGEVMEHQKKTQRTREKETFGQAPATHSLFSPTHTPTHPPTHTQDTGHTCHRHCKICRRRPPPPPPLPFSRRSSFASSPPSRKRTPPPRCRFAAWTRSFAPPPPPRRARRGFTPTRQACW